MNAHARLTALRAILRDNPLLLGIAAIGFAVSFQTIARLATQQHMPGWPVLYPILIDLGILGMIVEARRAIDDGRSDLVPRVLAWMLTGFTIYVNAHGSPADDWLGIALHVVAPGLWVAFLELTRWRKLRKARIGKPERIPLARWVFMPAATLGMKKRMVIHHVMSYRIAVAREEALVLATDLVRAQAGPKWRKTAPALLRHHIATGTLPEAVTRVAETAGYGSAMPSMAESVSEWVTSALTEADKMTATVRAAKRAIEADIVTPETSPSPRQSTRRKPASSHAKARRLLSANPPPTLGEVAKKTGLSERTVSRIKQDMPTPLRPRSPEAAAQ